MACFWKNERNAVEVCLREVGNYVYVGYESPDPDYSLIEVARDLSGYVKTPATAAEALANGGLYSKRRKIYQLRYNTTANPDTVVVYRDDGEPTFTEVAGVPTGLSPWSKQVTYTAGKLRAVNWGAGFIVSFYESDNGETWSLLPGSVSAGEASAGYPSSYTVLGGRIITNRLLVGSDPQFYYSDDGGATWVGGSAIGAGSSPWYPFAHSGSKVIAMAGSEIHVTADGATWTEYTGLYADLITANGAGRVVASGVIAIGSNYGFAYSSDHGTSWTTRTQVAGGIPDASTVYALFWDAVSAKFVVFVERSDTLTFQIYTSPTGQNWTAGLVIPEINVTPTQVID